MSSLPDAEWLLADRGYDADWFREALFDTGTTSCILGRKSRCKIVKYGKRCYKRRNRHILVMSLEHRQATWGHIFDKYKIYHDA